MKYYEYLSKINKIVCEDSDIISNNLQFFSILDDAIDDARKSSDDELFYNAMRATSLIILFQPFLDGNHRTGVVVFGNILNERGFDFDYNSALIDLDNGQLDFPVIYDKDDYFSYPDSWQKYISKRENIVKSGKKHRV